jgi:hypothetical protein
MTPAIGDYVVVRERVYRRGNRVGRDNAHCDVTRAGPEAFALACTVSLFLRGRGQIAMQGLFAYRRGMPGGDPTLAQRAARVSTPTPQVPRRWWTGEVNRRSCVSTCADPVSDRT